ncbi:MAG TPA: peptidylprolyl isomerase [Chromatiaceae bacterium]|nr:peptidylprolyl isomerase [Chromatiaceae bacterium]
MEISKDKVATLNYVLKNDKGEVMDESQDGQFAYLHGASNIIPGLESALEGKKAGDSMSVSVAPAEGYGERDLAQIQQVPRNMFPADVDIEPGMQFQAQSPEGQMMVVMVTAVNDDTVSVDGNHPLAGENLHFDVSVVDVRDASPEELEHGHVHGPDGHHHE